MNKSPEKWKPVVGFEGFYKVSNHGRVLSLGNGVRRREPRLLIVATDMNGYVIVRLRLNMETHRRYVHRLVAAAFIGPPPERHEIHHLDTNPFNNDVSNLSYVLHEDNLRFSIRRGDTKRNKLSHDDVRAIRLRLSCGDPISILSEEFHVTYNAIRRIKNGQGWKHVT